MLEAALTNTALLHAVSCAALTVFRLLTGTKRFAGMCQVSGGCAMAKSTRYTGLGAKAALRTYLRTTAAPGKAHVSAGLCSVGTSCCAGWVS